MADLCGTYQKEPTLMGLEPTTFGSEVRRAIHYATKPCVTIVENVIGYEGSTLSNLKITKYKLSKNIENKQKSTVENVQKLYFTHLFLKFINKV